MEEAIANLTSAFEAMLAGIGEAEFHNYSAFLLEGLDTLQATLLLTTPDGVRHEGLDLSRMSIGASPVVAAALLSGLRSLGGLIEVLTAQGSWTMPPDLAPDWKHWGERLAVMDAAVQQAGSASLAPDERVWEVVTLPLLAGYYSEGQPGVAPPADWEQGTPFKKPPGIVIPFTIYAGGLWYAAHGPSELQKYAAEVGDQLAAWRDEILAAASSVLDTAGDFAGDIGEKAWTAIKWIGAAVLIGGIGWAVMRGSNRRERY